MTERPLHVLFCGIDGVRWDVLQQTPTPALDRVVRRGFLAPVQVNVAAPTISGPSWASLFTGVLATSHNIYNNKFHGHRLAEYPDFITRALLAQPQLQWFAGAAWEPLVSEHSGGPLLGHGGVLPARRGSPALVQSHWFEDDQEIADEAVAAISGFDSGRGSVSFVYQHAVDTTGHKIGVDEHYVAALTGSDRRLGEVLDAVEARPTYAEEHWLIVVATDHGHIDAGGHGGDDPHERTAWIAACGPGVPTSGMPMLEQADVAGHILDALGITPDSPAFVGLPFGTRTELVA